MSFLQRIIATSTKWYHGRSVKDTKFDLKFAGQGHDREGPGFYFTSDEKDASQYAAPNGVILTVELKPRKLASTTKKPSMKEVKQLLENSPDLEDTLTNWDENPKVAFNMALESALRMDSQKEVFQQIWYDFYLKHPAEFLKQMVKLGYDGHEATWLSGDTKHLVIYNPDIIKIIEVKDY